MQDKLANAVAVYNGQPCTTSTKIAEIFGKQHRDVLRIIRNIETPEDFNQRNFAPVDYTDAKGEKRPMYQITRDGFTLLAMGFTGAKAMAFKVAYIEAFNAMEHRLAAPASLPLDAKEINMRMDAMARQIGNLAYALAHNYQMMSNGFVPPTVDDVASYCSQMGIDNVDPEAFCRYYAGRNWTQGCHAKPMTAWRCVVRDWSSRKAVAK